ncbi:uncharacterized protein LOC126655972 [Mercurialis annua]|uniref:uncharacterized protein LOC126655972 n=1 Tax=Mercurialis annua TaxID=3986 RepID=UPI00215EE3C2|nr:uncharacterized protein LOC126655972 [Mercurialis annua]
MATPTSPPPSGSAASNSPEFQFWMLDRKPSSPDPNLLPADQLFLDGVLLPLHLLQNRHTQPQISNSIPSDSTATTSLTSSKRWKLDLFRKADKKPTSVATPDIPQQHSISIPQKEKRREKKSSSSAELNINLWPFSRSRSAGNSGSRPRMIPPGTTRKVSSAPCSRSNSAGESKSRKWPGSPGRAGVHLGRSSPVWQVRRGEKMTGNKDRGGSSKTTMSSESSRKAKVVNLNAPMCMGYRQNLSCRNISSSSGEARTTTSTGGGGGGTLFNLRNLFTKKVY